MALNSYRLGELITQRREKKPENEELPIRGVSKDGFIPPKQIDADTDIYNVFYKKDFVYNPARMELGSIAFNSDLDKGICSSLYEMFFVHRTDICLPEYLALFVSQDEFARYCNFLSSGSAREYCRFANISQIKISLPSIEEQRKIVHDYKVITNRIELLKKINENLEEQIKAIIRNSIDEGGKKIILEDYCNIFTGKKDVNQAVENGKYNFYSCSPEPVKSNEYIYSGEAILVAGNGSYTGRTTYVNDTFDLYQRTYAIVAKDSNNKMFYILYGLLQTIFQDVIESKLHGSAIPYIVYNDLAKFEAKIKGDLDSLGNVFKSILNHEQVIKQEIPRLLSIQNALLTNITKEGV